MYRHQDLQIFVHIPKTAGEVFKRNIESSLPPSQFVRTSFTFLEHYYDIKAKEIKFYKGEEHFKEYIGSLNESQISDIRYLGGHDSYYGIHHLFKRDARYTTFVREPIARTVSLYNYERWIYDFFSKRKDLNVCEHNTLKLFSNEFLIDGRVPPFEEWLEAVYDQKNHFNYSMTRYLQHLKFLEKPVTDQALSEALTKFHFVGITEKYDEDSLFLYHPLSVNCFFSDKNVSPHYVSATKLHKSTLERIKSLNSDDLILYEAALKHNAMFKQKNKTFYPIVRSMTRKKKLYHCWREIKNFLKSLLRPMWRYLKPLIT